jgi:tripartite-type tricarboxylate transporter receptor subunit TctC
VLGDRTKGAAAKAAAHDVDRKTDHFPSRDFGAAVVAAVFVPEHRQQLFKQGQEAVYSSPEELGTCVKSESAKWARVINTAKNRG